MDSLKYNNLQHVKFQWRMIFKTNYFQLKIRVTHSTICCLWNKVTCIYEGEFTKCYGIMTNKASIIAFGSLYHFSCNGCISCSDQNFENANNEI